MSVVIKPLFDPVQPGTSAQTLYTVPSTIEGTIIDKFTVTNPTGGAVAITVYLVPNGGTAGNDNKIISAESISAAACRNFTELQNHILGPGFSIQAFAGSVDSLTVIGSGREVTANTIT